MTVLLKRAMNVSGATALTLVVLAGCLGSTPVPTPSSFSTSLAPPSSLVTSATSDPPDSTTAAGANPAATKADTLAGAEASVRYSLAQVNRAWTTADPKALAGLCASSSKACASLTSEAAILSEKSQRYASEPVTVQSMSAAATGLVHCSAIQNKVDILAGDGSVVSTDQRKLLDFEFLLKRVYDHWQVSEIHLVLK